MRRTLVFEDKGQDFLEWDVERKGDNFDTVIDCRPFQKWVWIGTRVSGVKINQRPMISVQSRWTELNYKIVRIKRQIGKVA